MEIEVQSDMQFVFVTTKPCMMAYMSDELAWTVRCEGHAGRSSRFNLLELQARRVSHAGRSGRASFSVKSRRSA